MRNIEIPLVEERGKRYRFFEMLPGLLSWSLLLLPFVLTLFNPRLCIIFIILFILIWFIRTMGVAIRALQGYKLMKQHSKLPWSQMLDEINRGKVDQPDRHIPSWHYENVLRLQSQPTPVSPDKLYHAIIVATHNESRAVLEPTFHAVLGSDYNLKRVILILAYEERGGPEVEKQAHRLIDEYGKHFKYAEAIKHPADLPNEIRGKGGNVTFAGRKLAEYVTEHKINPLNVVVTTLDADNHPHSQYLAALSYLYCASPDPLHVSYQPLPIYTNNIWDAPAPMRIIATGNSLWNIVLSTRQHAIRNFSAHAQSLQAVMDTDFWSTRTIVEDGHQFWRTYFRYDGQHEVYPLYVPIYQDAVLSDTLTKTIKQQFIQLRRWAWGASDIAYIAEKGFFTPNKVSKPNLIAKFFRILEGHVSWAASYLVLAYSALIPALLRPNDFAANQLKFIAGRIETLALIGMFSTVFICFKTLPPKPARYKHRRTVLILMQWALLPVTTILFNSFAALNAQTRLILGKYIDKFDATEKAVVSEDHKRTI